MEIIALSLFAAGLLACVAAGISVLYALLFGYALFFGYGLLKGHGFREMLKMSWRGVWAVRTIMAVFALIGLITAVWRASGTIPAIVYGAAGLISPSVFVLTAFLLNCLVSTLIGTAFGTSATVGVICMSIGGAMGISSVLLGGAVISGAYFGDRCSPMSASAHLTSELTGTDIFGNIRLMLKSSAAPFLLTCAIYCVLGLRAGGSGRSLELLELFPRSFSLHWLTLLPAALIVVMSVLRVNVKWTMLASIAAGGALCLTLQHMTPGELLRAMLTGYRAADPQLAAMLDGGGLVSMLRVAAIVCISSSYSGIFSGTGLLTGLKALVARLSRRTSPFCGALVTAVSASMVACNHTLAIMLTDQLCSDNFGDRRELALAIENTAVIVAPLIPWSIAAVVPVSVISAPASCLLAACYLYLLPLSQLLKARTHRHGRGLPGKQAAS